MVRYSWKAVWNRKDWVFSSLNMVSVSVTMLILVCLTGLLFAFKDYSSQVMDRLSLRIEVFKSKDALVADLADMEKQITGQAGVRAMYKRVPTFLAFYNATGKLVSGQSIRGCTVQPQEPWTLLDIHNRPVSLKSKQELTVSTQKVVPFDEIGILVSFDLLVKLEYLPADALFDKPESWKETSLPPQLKLYVHEKQTTQGIDLPVPIVGIVPDLYRGDYVITEEFYNVLCNWNHAFQYMLWDRAGKPLVTPQPQISAAYYVLTDDQQQWLEQNTRILDVYQEAMSVKLFAEFWDGTNGFEQRFNILPLDSGQNLNPAVLAELEQRLRTHGPLQNLGLRQDKKGEVTVREWQDFPAMERRHQYIQAAVYVEHRDRMEAVLDALRSLGLFANSPLERYLKTFARQEQFFTAATVGIFTLVLFLSGVVLFSTFYSGILRKSKEIGIFKAYGASRLLVLVLFYLQSTIVLGVGCLLGVFGGIQTGKVLSRWLTHFTKSQDALLTFQLPPVYIVALVAIMLLTCWASIFIPVRIATSIDPAEVVRG
jgi:cell division protein FtsX